MEALFPLKHALKTLRASNPTGIFSRPSPFSPLVPLQHIVVGYKNSSKTSPSQPDVPLTPCWRSSCLRCRATRRLRLASLSKSCQESFPNLDEVPCPMTSHRHSRGIGSDAKRKKSKSLWLLISLPNPASWASFNIDGKVWKVFASRLAQLAKEVDDSSSIFVVWNRPAKSPSISQFGN